MKRHTAKQFMGPLLLVLYRLSDGKPGIPVPMPKTFDPVLSMVGVSEEDAKSLSREGRPQGPRWVQEAFKNLKSRGAVDSPSPSQWALTEFGCAQAKKHIKTHEGEVPVPAPQATNTSKPAAPEPGLPTVITPGYEETGYHPDPYIRTLAFSSKNTPCFGGFSQKAKPCGTCPAAGACKNFAATLLTQMVRDLHREDLEEEEARKKTETAAKATKKTKAKKATEPDPLESVSEEPTAPAVEVSPEARNFDFFDEDWHSPQTIMVRRTVLCQACGSPVKKDALSIYLKNKRGGGSVFHWDCVPPRLRPVGIPG